MALTHGFGATVYYVAEATFNTAVTNPAYKRFSNFVESVKVKKSRSKEAFRSIDSPSVVDFLAKTNKVDLEVTYILQRVDPLDTIATRTAGVLPSYQIEVSANTAVSGSDVYYVFNGGKANLKLGTKNDDYVRITVTFMGAAVTQASAQPTVGAGSREAALSNSTYPALTFSGASVTNAGGAWEAGLTAFDVTLDNGLEALPALGSAVITGVGQGAITIKGTADVYLDSGGGTHLTAVESDTGVSIVFNTGGAGSPKFTIGGVEFGDFEVDLNNKDAIVKRSIPFEGTSFTVGSV